MDTIRIVPAATKDGKLPLSQGTQVFAGDTELEGVCEISVHYSIDEPVRASISLIDCWQDPVIAIGEFFMSDPITNQRKQVKRIEFEDGTAFQC